MKRTIQTLLVVCIGLGFAASAFAIDVPLKYQKYPAGSDDFYPRGVVALGEIMEPPSGGWKFPTLVSEHPIYAFVEIGDKQKLCILDQQNASNKFYNRFYLDSNGNGDLTDDPFVEGTVKLAENKQSYTVEFPGVDTKIEVDGRSLPYSFCPYVRTRLFQLERRGFTDETVRRYVALSLRSNCSYTGELKIKGQKYRVILSDYNCNGRFNERFTLRKMNVRAEIRRMPIFAQGDGFIITDKDKIDAYDVQLCGDWLVVDDQLFEVSIDMAKGKMTLKPMTENLGSLRLTMQTECMSIYTEDGQHLLMMYQPREKIMVPADKYRLFKYKALKQDKQGDLWRLSASANTESPFIVVDGEREAVLEFGEPYVSIVNAGVRGESSKGFLSFSVEGRAKETLSDLSHISGDKTQIPLSEEEGLGQRPREPTYKVVKSDGEVVAQGSFEYG